jgi:hypothetical protein
MKLNQVLQQLKKRDIKVEDERVDEEGNRSIVIGCALPSIPFGENRFAYATIVLKKGCDEVSAEQRETVKHRLWLLTQDIFGDDPEAAAAEAEDELEDDEIGSHFHPIIRKE